MEGGQGRREPPSIKSAGSATPVFVVADYDNEHDTDSDAGRICTSLQPANEMSWSSVPASRWLDFARRVRGSDLPKIVNCQSSIVNGLLQCLFKVGDDIFRVFNSSGKPYQVVRHAQVFSFFPGHFPETHGSDRVYDAFNSPQAG